MVATVIAREGSRSAWVKPKESSNVEGELAKEDDHVGRPELKRSSLGDVEEAIAKLKCSEELAEVESSVSTPV